MILCGQWQATAPEPTTCHVPDCGNVRCSVCDERMTCTGPEPAVNTCAAHDDECSDCNGENRCRECAVVRRAA